MLIVKQVKKVFDVTCTLIDVMSCVPMEPPSGLKVGPRDYLEHFLGLIGRLRGGQDRYLPLLIGKIKETLPGMVSSSIPRRLPSASLMAGMNLDSMNFPDDSIGFPAAGLKTEFSDLSETPPFDSEYVDGDSAMDSPYSMALQSSYSA